MDTNGTRMKAIVAASLLAVGVVAVVLLWPRDERQPVTEPPASVAGKKPVFVLIPTPVQKGLVKTPPEVMLEAAVEGQDPQKVVRIQSNQILATVNRIPVTLKDLMGEGRGEAVLLVEEYAYLLNRTIEREAAIQAALSQRVTLTEGQMRISVKVSTCFGFKFPLIGAQRRWCLCS